MRNLGTIVTVNDPYAGGDCAAIVIGVNEDGTVNLRVFRADQNDLELVNVPLAGEEPTAETTAADETLPAAPELPPTAPTEDGTAHADLATPAPAPVTEVPPPAPVVATPVQ